MVLCGCWYLLVTTSFPRLTLAGWRVMGLSYVKPKFQSWISYLLRHITGLGEWFLQATVTNIIHLSVCLKAQCRLHTDHKQSDQSDGSVYYLYSSVC